MQGGKEVHCIARQGGHIQNECNSTDTGSEAMSIDREQSRETRFDKRIPEMVEDEDCARLSSAINS